MPITLVMVDMKIGRIRWRVATRMALRGSMPWSRARRSVPSTSRIALLTTVPIRMTKPSSVSMSSGWRTYSLSRARPRMPPAVASGTEKMMMKG